MDSTEIMVSDPVPIAKREGTKMSTTPDPEGLTALIIGDAPVVHAAEAVNYHAPDYDTVDGADTETPAWE